MSTKKKTITIGADPELFIQDTETMKFISAHDIIPGNKWLPKSVPRGAIQVDGLAAEFNIEPTRTYHQFQHNINHVKRLLLKYTQKKSKFYHLVAKPSVVFDKEYLDTLPEDILILGCSPDFNAYTGDMNPRPDGEATNMRTGAGHIHVGWTGVDTEETYPGTEHFNQCCDLVKSFDFALIPASKTWDFDTERTKLYGAPGAFRPKNYGVEYRVLSNAWLVNDWSTKYVHDSIRAISSMYLNNGFNLIEQARKDGFEDNSDLEKVSNYLSSKNIPSVKHYNPAYYDKVA